METFYILIFGCTTFGLLFCHDAVIENDPSTLDTAAFNIRVFGVAKMKDSEVINILVKILIRYDLILVQEIRDSTGNSVQRLLLLLSNEVSKKIQGASYGIKLSPRLGRTNSKEEYAYIYRKDILQVSDSFTYNDVNNVFEREPFVARFKAPAFAVDDFAVAGIHTSPRDAQNEISNLTHVYDAIQQRWRVDDVIIMGDFNGGCSYVEDWSKVHLARDPRFYWIIDHSKDTTAESSDCPYDRIVVSGNELLDNILPHSGGVFYYDEEFNLSHVKALLVSDHYPVHMQIRSKEEKNFNWFSESITIHDDRITKTLKDKHRSVYDLRTKALSKKSYQVDNVYKVTGAYSEITISSTSRSQQTAIRNLDKILMDFPGFVSMNQLNIARRFIKSMNKRDELAHGHGRYKTLYDYYAKKKLQCDTILKCSLATRSKPECVLTIEMSLK